MTALTQGARALKGAGAQKGDLGGPQRVSRSQNKNERKEQKERTVVKVIPSAPPVLLKWTHRWPSWPCLYKSFISIMELIFLTIIKQPLILNRCI